MKLVTTIIMILLLSVFLRSVFSQADLDYERFTGAMTRLSEVGREVYELGFNDGVQCMVLIQLRYKYGDEEPPTLKEMGDICRAQWYVEMTK